MSTLQRIDQLEGPPVLGRFYLVPTVRYRYRDPHLIEDWPVLGTLHEDKEHIGFPYWHYHVDARFIRQDLYQRVISNSIHPVNVIFAAHPLQWRDLSPGKDIGVEEILKLSPEEARAFTIPHPPIVWRRRRMHREFVYPRGFIESHMSDKRGRGGVQEVWPAYAGQTAKRGKRGFICPHKNYPLNNVAPDEQGVLTCPLHGLRICSRTGLIEPQHTQSEAAE